MTGIFDPGEIEKKSMELIGEELDRRGIALSPEYDFIVRRVIHTTADFDFAGSMRFSAGAVDVGLTALKSRGAETVSGVQRSEVAETGSDAKKCDTVIITDTNMTLSGISKPGLKKLGASAVCYMADEDVARKAEKLGVTRAVVSVRKAVRENPDRQVIYAVGNAPTALFELIEQMNEGFRPALIIAVPVGFVNVKEAKEAVVATCEKYGVPCIAAMGNKGGSTVSAAICNALIYRATGVR